jgi:uncharacterized protein
MNRQAHHPDTVSCDQVPAELQWLSERIHHAAHLLPAQGPIGVFIHHNTLHAFEHQTFDEAVRTGSRIFGCEPYLTEDRYRAELSRGCILFSELRTVLERDLGAHATEAVHGLTTRVELRLAMLQHPLRSGEGHELDWFTAETDALQHVRRDVSEVQRRRLITETRHWVMRRLRGSLPGVEHPAWIEGLFSRFEETRIEDWSDARWEAFTLSALWEVCGEGVRMAGARTPSVKPIVRHRDLVVALGGIDSDLLVNEVMIRSAQRFWIKELHIGRCRIVIPVSSARFARSIGGEAEWRPGG